MALEYYLGLLIGIIVGGVSTAFWVIAYYSRAAADVADASKVYCKIKDREIDDYQDRLERALDYIAKLKERAGYDGRDVDEWDN